MSPYQRGTTEHRPFFGRVEALRGIGALTVAGYHFSGCVVHGVPLLQLDQWPDVAPVQHALARIGLFLLPGHAFLMAFFAISGFVLRLSLDHGPRAALVAAAKFVLGRLFRFYPIVAVGVILSAALVHADTGSDALTVRQFVANLLLLDVSLNKHLWALQVELLVIPVILTLFFLERRWGSYVIPLVALTTTGLAFCPSWAGWPPLSINLFAFALGMMIPTLGRRFASALSKRVATQCVLGSVAVMLAAGPCLGVYARFTTVTEAYAAWVAISIVVYRSDLSMLKWLDARWLHRLGSAAGSFYVLHMAIAPVMIGVATRLIPAAWSVQAPGAVGLLVIALWLVVLTPLMMGAFHLVEAPGIALGRRVIRSLGLASKSRSRFDRVDVIQKQAA